MPVGWFPDPTPSVVVAPGWGVTVPDQTDPLVEVGWWALTGLDMAGSFGVAQQALGFQLIRMMAYTQMAAASQSLALQKIAALQFSNTATASQTLAMQRLVEANLQNVSPATQALGLARVVDLALIDAPGAAQAALAMVKVGTLALANTAPATQAAELTKIAGMDFSSTAPAGRVLQMVMVLSEAFSSTTPPLILFGVGYPPTAEVTTSYTVGAQAYTYVIPRWADAIDVIILGAGAGGSGGSFFGNGAGGLAGQWLTATWRRGIEIPFSALQITGVVGNWPSTACTALVAGGPSLSQAARSGTVQITNPVGQSPGTQVFNTKSYVGGATQGALGITGNAPGGGGGGGGWNGPGGNGTPGAVWLRAYQQ